MRILAVVVTFNSDPKLLGRVLESVAPQVQGVAVVDNGSANAANVKDIASAIQAHVIGNEENFGIAAAQNQGAALAKAKGYSHILLLDQDTVLAPGVVVELSNNLAALEKLDGKVAAIGPAYYELNSQKQTRAYRAHGLLLSRLSLEGQAYPVESDFIIASGSLIPLAVLEKVGNFKEDLFIDLVDVEWCFRARAAGYRSHLSPAAKVDHRLGSGTVGIGKRQIAVHIPIRNYYWVRNALWLARQSRTPPAWKLYFISRALAFIIAYTTFTSEGGLRLRLMSRAVWDSFNNHLGKVAQKHY